MLALALPNRGRSLLGLTLKLDLLGHLSGFEKRFVNGLMTGFAPELLSQCCFFGPEIFYNAGCLRIGNYRAREQCI